MASDTPETSVVEDVQLSPCCQLWKNKYSKAEKGRICLKEAVHILQKGYDSVQAQNLALKKAYEEEQARTKVEKEGRERELALKLSLENELSVLKSEMSELMQKGVSDVEDKTIQIKLLKATLSDREKEINWLKELVEKEKKRADLEMKKAAEGSKCSETENINAGDEQRLLDIEQKKVEDYGTQLEHVRKEVSEAKSKLVFEKSKCDEATKKLKEEQKKAVEERKRADSEMAKAREQMRIAEETKRKAVDERKCADSEMDKAREQMRITEETKRKAVDERKRADLEMAKAEEQRKIAVETKKKAVDEQKRADLEMAKAEEQRKIAEETKKKAVGERRRADLEMAKAEEQRKIAEETKKKAVDEIKRADFEMAKAEEKKKIAEETKKAVEERTLVDLERAEAEEQGKIAEQNMKKAAEVRKLADFEMAKAEEQRKIAEETAKAVEDRKRAVVEMAKEEEQRKISVATEKKAFDGKLHANNLAKRLEEARRKNEELEKKLYELSGSINLGEGPIDQLDKKASAAAAKSKKKEQLGVLKEDAEKSRPVSESLQFEKVEKEKVISERKQVDLKMRKAEKKRKLEDANTKMAMEGKQCCNHLSKQLEDARLKINELQKQVHELSFSRKMVGALVVPSDKDTSADVAEIKLLKKHLKFEKRRVKHAKDVARLEKSRNNLLQQELGCMKLDIIQFLNRLDTLDRCFSSAAEGIDDTEKAGDFARMQWSKLKQNLGSLNSRQTCLRTENQLLKTRCMGTTAPNPLVETFQHDAQVLPVQRGNLAESITGINSKLESLLGGSNKKMLQSSAINSSTASFSDRQLVGSQERGAFSVTTSAKLSEEDLNLQPTISSMSGEITKDRCNENLAVVAENSVRSPLRLDPLRRVNGRVKKRKMIHDAVESIELLCCESKNLHLLLEEKLSVLNYMIKGQMDKSKDEVELVRPNLQGIAYPMHDRSRKKRKTSHEETVALEQSCDDLQMKQLQSYPECLCNPDTVDPKIMVGFEEVVNDNYMKLLDLDNAAEEECYRRAAEMPVSPTLPEIEFPVIKTFEMDQFRPLQDEDCERFYHENENTSFDVRNVENGPNKVQCNTIEASSELLQQENGCSFGSFNIQSSCITQAGNACLSQSHNSAVEVEMSVVPSSGDGVANIPSEIELIPTIESLPKFCVVFSDIKDGRSVSRIFSATKACMAQCSLPAQTEFVVDQILFALKLEENLLSKEKVCVFFSLVLLNFCTATSATCSLIRDFIPCLNLFDEHMNKVMSDAEPRSVLAKLCLDELLSVIEDFLIEGRVMLFANQSLEPSGECDSRIHVIIDGSDVIYTHEAAPADLLLAGSIILASICIAADRAGFLCEAMYNIFRMHRYDTSVVLLILHVFAYVGGDKIFTSRKYSLTMTVLKSIVMFLESEHAPVGIATLSSMADVLPQVHACVGCPFSKHVLSVDIVVSSLFAKLQHYAQSGMMHQDLAANSNVKSSGDKAEQNLSCVLDMNCDVSCCLSKCSMPGKHSGSVVTWTLCDISDVISLMELLACNMSWEWTCKKIIAQLWSVLESSVIENLTVAIIILLGQVGRIGVDAVGSEDIEVENLRVKLSAFLWRETTIKAGLPVQLATITALTGLLPLDFEKVILENFKLPVMLAQFVPEDLMRNWFALLTEKQRAILIRLFQSVD